MPSRTVTLPGKATIGSLLRHLEEAEARGKPEGVRAAGRHLVVLVNGRNVASLDGWNTKLRDGDCVMLVVPAAGG